MRIGRRFTASAIAVALCFVVISLPVAAQRRAGSATVDVTVVEIPVNVVAPDGTPVRGLTRDHFEVLEDGRRRELAFFEVVDLGAPPPPEASRLLHPAARRSFLLLFDLSNSTPHAIGRSVEAARSFVDDGLEERDLAAVATWSNERGFRLLTAFTTDRALLRGAIRTLGHPKFFRTTDPLLMAMDPGLIHGGSTARTGEIEAMWIELVEDANHNAERMDQAWRRGRIDQQLQSLGAMARMLDAVPGRKQVVFLSEGFDARLLHGQEDIGAEAMAETNAAVLSGEVWKVDNEQRFGSTRSVSQLNGMAELFRRSDVMLHAIDIQGLRSNVGAREGRRDNSNEALFLMANGTGGQVFKNSNDIARNFEAMVRQQEVTYILGFQTSGKGDPSKFHELKVRVKEAPRGTRVAHRPGYYEVGEGSSGIERALSAVTILVNDIPRDEIRVDALAVPFSAASGDPVVPVILEIDGESLAGDARAGTLNGELFVYAFDPAGGVQDFLYQKVGLDLDKVGPQLREGGVKFYGSLALPPGEYDVKTLVRIQEGGRDGFRSVRVTVPDFAGPAVLPPLPIEGARPWIMVKSPPRRPAEVDYPFTIASESFVPESVAELKNGEGKEVALFTYNLAPEGLQLGGRVKTGDGSALPAKLALLGRSPDGTAGISKLLLQFTPAALAPGRYALELDVRHADAGLSETVAMPFVVR